MTMFIASSFYNCIGSCEYQYHLNEINRYNSLCEAFSSLLVKMLTEQSSHFSVSDDLKVFLSGTYWSL